MLATFRHRNFTLLWAGGLISQIGNWMLFVALPFYIYELTDSALATGAWIMASVAPGVLLGSVAGVFADRWDRRRTMVIINVLQAVVMLPLLLVQSPELVWIIYLVTFVSSSLAQFFGPSENALLPTLVPEEQLVAANSLNATNDNLARIVGPAIGGILLGISGLGAVILADMVTFLGAAALIFAVRVPPKATLPVAEDGVEAVSLWRQVYREWLAGLQLIKSRVLLRNSFIIIGLALFGDAIISALLVVFVQDIMALDAQGFGYIMTARGVGGIIGGIAVAQVGNRYSPAQLITFGLTMSGLVYFIVFNFPFLWLVLTLMVVAGPVYMAWIASMFTMLQRETEDEYRGRVFGAFNMVNGLLIFVGSGIAGGAADIVGAPILLNIAAAVTILAGLLAFPLLIGAVRQPVEAG